MYIAIDGIGGCGKSTQCKILGEKLGQSLGFRVIVEPGTTEFGEVCRKILLEGYDLCDKARAYLFAAAREQMFIGMPENVISDRCFLSTFAYQQEWILPSKVPDLIAILDTDVEECIKRRSVRKDAFTFDLTKGERIRERFKAGLFRLSYVEVRVIDGNGSVEEVASRIWSFVQENYDTRKGN